MAAAGVKETYRPSADETREAMILVHTCNVDGAGLECSLCAQRDELIARRRHPEQSASIREVVESLPFVNYNERHPVSEFAGEIDGGGVKQVMREMKCPLELIPPQFVEGIAEVLKYGAQKYAPNNWMRGMSWETVAGGILRHVTAFRRGEEMDPETGLPHLHHAACGLMFLSWYAHGPQESEHREMDDRRYKQAP